MNSMKVIQLNASCAVLWLIGAALPLAAQETIEPHGGMLRYPDISATQIVFRYADDLWVVPREGGVAKPLASPDGGEHFPRFSPNGKTVAFVGNYDGNMDIYTLNVAGGVPRRVTFHAGAERLCDWTFDGHLVFAMNGRGGLRRHVQLFQVGRDGGLPQQLPVPYGGFGVVSPNGEWLAYTPHNRDFRTWKRYRGGWASDIWLFHLSEHTSKRITDWEGTDTIPMWNNDSLYYLSDAGPHHRLNIWQYNLETESRSQVTRFRDYDVKWPSNGPGPDGEGEIIFEYNGRLFLLNLASNNVNPVAISIPGARPQLRPIRKEVDKAAQNWTVSPSGKRILVEARGDIWSLPAEHGSPRNLTRTSGVAEREPSWSPDGKWITYFSDAGGENQLVLHPAHGNGEPQTVTSFKVGYRYQPLWAPDSTKLVFTDHENRFFLFSVDDHEAVSFDRVNVTGWRFGVPRTFRWSPDSRWITYTRPNRNNMEVVMLYDTENEERHQVTQGMFPDALPAFDRKGDFLYFFSRREISEPEIADIGYDFVYQDTMVAHALPLRGDVSNPLKPKSDEELPEEKSEEEDKDKNKDKDRNGEEENHSEQEQDEDNENGHGEKAKDKSDQDKSKKKDKPKPVEIDLENMERRAFRLPIKRGRFSFLAVNDKHQLVYQRQKEEGSDVQLFDPFADEPEEKTVVEDASITSMTPDGKRLLVASKDNHYLIETKPDQKLEEPVVTGPMRVVIEPRKEWRQIFTDAWRFMRDYFYDPNMHQVDWPGVRKQYEAMLKDCVSRRDVGYVIREMISELNAGHTYYRSGDVESGPELPVGDLGADFELDQGHYRVRKFYHGAVWDSDARSILHSLDQEKRKAFNYLFEVNGVAVDTDKSPWAAFEGLAGETVRLTVGPSPDPDEATNVVVTLLNQDEAAELRYRDWVERNRQYVAEQTDGKVGYVHVPNTADRGRRELFRQFYGQMNLQALIIDERWNGGGNIADRFVELLNRPIYLHLFERYENDWRVPVVSHQGPKCMLINEEAGSGGDIFPYLFRKAGLGKLIGKRTWGGVIGIYKNPPLIDGAVVTVPFITFYETDGTLTMEGHGVEPDIEVMDDPAKMVNGGDPQLDAAIEHMLQQIKENPYQPAERPPYPDRSGMGILEQNK